MARQQNKKISQNLPKKLYFFVCEDEKSMCCYLDGIKRKYRQKVHIEIRSSNQGRTAKQVQRAAEAYERELRRKLGKDTDYTVVACFDKDKNNLKDITAILDNNKTKMTTIYNNPCYEYWLILHTDNVSPSFTSSEECARLAMKKISRKYKKTFTDLSAFKQFKDIFKIVGDDLDCAILNAKSQGFTDYGATYTNAHKIFEEIIS